MKKGFPLGTKPSLIKLEATYLQEKDCQDGGEGVQEIKLEAHYEGDFFFTIKTDRWAIDNAKELADIVKDFEKRLEL